MPKTSLDRFKMKHGWKGKSYRELMARIIANNTESVEIAVARLNEKRYTAHMNKVKVGKKIIIPDLSSVIPQRSVFIRKGATRGDLLADSLRDKLTEDLRQTLKEVGGTGEQAFITRRGKASGRVSTTQIRAFEERIKDTFKGYVKNDPKIGMPRNIHAIAVTEIRSAANEMKFLYANNLVERNEGMKLVKRWIHNGHLSKSKKFWREGHRAINGKTVALEKPFVVMGKDGQWHRLMHPHDPEADAGEVIGCHCDFDIIVRKI